MTKAQTQHTAESPARKKTLTVAERCKAYREKIAQDPILLKKMRDDDKARAKRNRQKLKTPEQIQHEQHLQRLCQKRYEERKKQKAAEQVNTTRSCPLTRLDKEKTAGKREANRLAVRKHRANQTAQKRRCVNEKRMARYYKQKETLKAAEQAQTEKATEARMEFQSSGCPYPNKESFQQAVRHVHKKINAKGKKFAFLYKGLAESADKGTKQALGEVGINIQTPQTPTVALQTHMYSLPQPLEDGSDAAAHTQDPPDGSQQMLPLRDYEDAQEEEGQEFKVYSSPPGGDNDIDDSMSCDLSCDSIHEDKHMMRELIEEQNRLLAEGHEIESSDLISPDMVTGDHSDLPSAVYNSERIPRPNSYATSNRGSRRRRDSVDADVEELEVNSVKRQRVEEGEENSRVALVNTMMSYLLERMKRREDRKRARARRREETSPRQSSDQLWAKHVLQQIREIGCEEKRKMLKLKISQMIIDYQMEDLQQK